MDEYEQCGTATQLENATFHDVDNALGELDEALQGFTDRLVARDLCFAERYLRGEAYFLYQGRVGAESVEFTGIM